MATKITFYGHACIGIELENYFILIDPFFVGNPLAQISPNELSPNLILVTHAHQDHFGDTITIATKAKSKIVSSPEIIDYCKSQNLEGHGLYPDEAFIPKEYSNISIKAIRAVHNSFFADGTYGGQALGFTIKTPDVNIYHAGDTSFYDGLKSLEGKVDIGFLPIGDPYVMSFDDIIDTVKLIDLKTLVPIHYNTKPELTQNIDEFIKYVNRHVKVEIIPLKPMETIVYPRGSSFGSKTTKSQMSSSNLLGGSYYNINDLFIS